MAFRRLRRFGPLVWLLAVALTGMWLGSAAAARYFSESQYRLISKPRKSRLGMAVTRANSAFPGVLVVEGALQVGLPQTVDDVPAHKMAVFARVATADGTVLVEEQVGQFTIPSKLAGVEYPIYRVYDLPPGRYQVELLGFDLASPALKLDGTPQPHASSLYWLTVR